jgi:hypothetical protein
MVVICYKVDIKPISKKMNRSTIKILSLVGEVKSSDVLNAIFNKAQGVLSMDETPELTQALNSITKAVIDLDCVVRIGEEVDILKVTKGQVSCIHGKVLGVYPAYMEVEVFYEKTENSINEFHHTAKIFYVEADSYLLSVSYS